MKSKKDDRIGLMRVNNSGYIMKIIEYNNCRDMLVEFQDENKARVKCEWKSFDSGQVKNPHIYQQRMKELRTNNQGCLMKIVEYNKAADIVVEFQDAYKGKVHTSYNNFISGGVKNPYFPSVYGVGMFGTLYPAKIRGKTTKEYDAWTKMLQRCYSEVCKCKQPTYKDVICCKEWLLYENFYEWLHEQENFEHWLNSDRWEIDKDILIKGSKIYSPETCCLVPLNVNNLFIKSDAVRGEFPIGVRITRYNTFQSYCNNPYKNKVEHLGTYGTSKQAFLAYKKRKEEIIKQVAQEEYDKGNITKQCYDAMMKYEVEITD